MPISSSVKERPIIFNDVNVRAIFDRRKRQSRRVVKEAPTKFVKGASVVEWDGSFGASFHCTDGLPTSHNNMSHFVKCPYGRVGDRLWVRERWRFGGPFFDARLSDYHDPEDILGEHVHYASDEIVEHFEGTWRSPRFMPRWASRLTLEITNVRVERLQDISADDLTAEGYPPDNSPPHDGTRPTFYGRKTCFAESWDQKNEKRGYSWESNPWVWAMEFTTSGRKE